MSCAFISFHKVFPDSTDHSVAFVTALEVAIVVVKAPPVVLAEELAAAGEAATA